MIKDLDVLKKIGQVKTDKFNFPLENLRIEEANVLDHLESDKINEIDNYDQVDDEDANGTNAFFSFS